MRARVRFTRHVARFAFVLVVWTLSLTGAWWLAEAASGGADGTYTVTITKVEVSKDSGTTYTTVFSGSQVINIASANAGAVAAGLVSGTPMDAGTYDQVRVTLGSTLQLKGFRNTGSSTTDYTNGTSFNTVAGNDAGSDYAVSTFTIPEASRIQTFTGYSIVVSPGGAPKVTITFNTSGVIIAGPSINPPSVTVTSS